MIPPIASSLIFRPIHFSSSSGVPNTGVGHFHLELWNVCDDAAAGFVDAQVTAVGDGAGGLEDVGTVVGKGLAGLKAGKFANDTIALDGDDFAGGFAHNPFAALDGDGGVAIVLDGDKVGKTVGHASRDHGLRLVHNVVDVDVQAGQLGEGVVGHRG